MENLTFEFVHIEEGQLLPHSQAIGSSLVALFTLVSGLIVNIRVFKLLWRKKLNGCTATIDNLFLMYNIVSLACHPPLLIYFAAKPLIFPIGDYIGKFGCGFLMLFLDIFIRFFALAIPFCIALLRFTLVILSSRFMTRTINMWATIFIYMTLALSIFVTLTVQLPPSDFAQGPYNYCLGRFEVYFNPQHPDPITPGRRQGLEWCEIHFQLVNESHDSWSMYSLRLIHYILCRLSLVVYFIFVLSFPEAILYAITFWNILGNTRAVADSGILKSDILKRRKQKNTLNIYLTFWAWLIQYIINMFNFLVTRFIFGKSPFLHSLFSLFQLTFNFTIMPFLYILVADETIKTHLLKKEFASAFKRLLTL